MRRAVIDILGQPGEVGIDDIAETGDVEFLGLVKFLLRDGGFIAGRNGAVAVGIDADERAAAVEFSEDGRFPFIGVAAKVFHLNWLMAQAEDGIAHGSAIVLEVLVGGANEDFHIDRQCDQLLSREPSSGGGDGVQARVLPAAGVRGGGGGDSQQSWRVCRLGCEAWIHTR